MNRRDFIKAAIVGAAGVSVPLRADPLIAHSYNSLLGICSSSPDYFISNQGVYLKPDRSGCEYRCFIKKDGYGIAALPPKGLETEQGILFAPPRYFDVQSGEFVEGQGSCVSMGDWWSVNIDLSA